MTVVSVNAINASVQGISNSTQGLSDILGRLATGSFRSQLQPASFRGVPFVVTSITNRFGRRNAVHEYPFRDEPWVEDLGRSARRFQISGFIVGDDVIAQRARMIAAVESPGDGALVHPTLGRMRVALIDFSTDEDIRGRVFAFTFSFIRQGQRLYPAATPSGTDAVGDAAGAADTSAAAAFARRALGALSGGAAEIDQVAKQAAAFSAQATQYANDATSLIKLAVTLPGSFGRLVGLASGIATGGVTVAAQGTTIADLTGAAAAAREAVAVAAGALTAAARTLSPRSLGTFTTAAQTLASAVRAAASTPGDALRSLGALAGFAPVGAAAGAQLVVQGAAADAFRRAALTAMARAGADYEPSSSNDALAARAQVLAVVDAEIDVAGDQGDDDVFMALRALRAVVVQDLNARGASLPSLRTVSVAAPLPSLVLAQRLYRDASRADELVARAMPRHPAFMPVTFEALNA
ncbi:MAG: DNA circularization protein [Dokdonella sp.]|uniref:DNA circularization protein n=1 Tax=Dokdonella sp. TaxID=2291710 RepID=UPI003F7EEE5E